MANPRRMGPVRFSTDPFVWVLYMFSTTVEAAGKMHMSGIQEIQRHAWLNAAECESAAGSGPMRSLLSGSA
jgi:hypothetical protein